MKHRIFALLLCLLLIHPLAAGAQDSAAEEVLKDILAFKMSQSDAKNVSDWVSSALPGMMGAGGEWYAIGLVQSGEYDLSVARASLVDYLVTHTVRAAATRQKLALTLLALGDEHDYIQKTLADSIGKQGLMSWTWGLHLLNNGCESPDFTSEDCIKALLALRKEDGGWAITGNQADADATAMVLQALAPHRDRAEIADAIERALSLLSSMQTQRGGFSSYGVENAESAAQVIIALCALGVDPLHDARFIKNDITVVDALEAYKLPGGGFSHEHGGVCNENATAQAFLANVAYERFRTGLGSLYLLDDDPAPGTMQKEWSWQSYAAAAIGGVAVLLCMVMLVMDKRHPKNFLAVAVVAAVLIGGVFLLDVQSADSYYSTAVTKAEAIGSITLTIRCDKVAGRAAHIPADGVILAEAALPIAAGDTVYTVLTDAARSYGFHMEASGANGMMYIHGIGNIYEFDFGDLSGWLYMVNDDIFSVGVDQYVLSPGDKVELHYTLELGKDIQ